MNSSWQLDHYSMSTGGPPISDLLNLTRVGSFAFFIFEGFPLLTNVQMSLVVYRCAQSTIKQYKIIELSLKNETWRHDQRYLNSSLPRQCYIESLPLLCCFFTEVKSCKTCHNWCVIMLHCEL